MPRTSPPNKDYLILTILTVVVVITLLILISFSIISRTQNENIVVRSSRSKNIEGTLLFHTLLDRLGFVVKRNKKSFDADLLSGTDVVVVFDPLIPLRSDELVELRAWLGSGGTLMTTTPPLFDELKDFHDINTHFHCRMRHRKGNDKRSTRDEAILEILNPNIKKDVEKIHFDTKRVYHIENTDKDDSPKDEKRFEPTLLVVDDLGVRVAEFNFGKGKLILVSDCSFLSNGSIEKSDNATFAVRLVEYAAGADPRRKSILYDEYHFGAGSHNTGINLLIKHLFTSPAGWGTLVLSGVACLLLWRYGRQFGPRYGLGKNRRRSKMEFVVSTGETLKKAGRTNLVLKIIYNELKAELCARYALSTTTSNQRLADEIAIRSNGKAEEIVTILDECDNVLKSKRNISEIKLSSIIKSLSEIEYKQVRT